MKTALIFILSVIISTTSGYAQVAQDDLKLTCGVLCKLTDEAIDNDRKDLIAIYYNAFQGLRLNHELTNGTSCKEYFDAIKTIYGEKVGTWTVGIGFLPFPAMQIMHNIPGDTSNRPKQQQLEKSQKRQIKRATKK